MASIDTTEITERAQDIEFRINQLIADISKEHPSIERAYMPNLLRIKKDTERILDALSPESESEQEEEGEYKTYFIT